MKSSRYRLPLTPSTAAKAKVWAGTAAALALLSACGADHGGAGYGSAAQQDDSKTGTVSEAVLGGATTSARPEVGYFSTGIAGCTATMITTRVGIAAAHCVDSVPYPIVGASFTSGVAGATPVSIDNVYVFAPGPGVHPADGDFNLDVMLFETSSAIAGITPAKIATTLPKTGDTVTLIGYGCNVASPPSGGGTKRYKEFAYSTTTDAACSGDSGGPLLLGTLASNGPITAVVSTADPAYGNVTMLGESIAAVIRRWNGGVEPNLDRPGMNIGSGTASSGASDCQTQCDQSPNSCASWTYVTSTAKCWLHSAAMPFSPATGVTSGVKTPESTNVEANVNRPGGDYAHFPNTPPGGCSILCSQDARCEAYTMDSASTCWLKWYAPAPIVAAGLTSGVRAPRIPGGVGVRVTDNFISQFSPKTFDGTYNYPLPSVCEASCNATANCNAWVFQPPTFGGGATCYLSSGSPNTASLGGLWVADYKTDGTLFF